MATLSDVAREAGVSPTAVSRYLNNRIELPRTTRERIDAAIAKLDYRPNLLAKRLSTGKTEAIALITPEIANPFFAELAAAIESEAEKFGYAVYVSSTRGDKNREIDALNRLRDQHVDGLIMMTNTPDDGTLARLIAGQRVVVLDEDIPGVSVPRVFVENTEGAYLATRHLTEAGHREIALVSGPEGLMSVRERRDGYLRALGEAGIAPDPAFQHFGDYTRAFGHEAAHALFALDRPPSAIVACSDYIAVGVLHAAQQLGRAVPRDFSLVGFDDMAFAELVAPPLTTIRQPVPELGKVAFARLHAAMEGRKVPPLTRLPVSLVIRHSVANIERS